MQKYSVKQFCDMVGVPFSTLRYYERIGLLTPHQDEMNKYRQYTVEDAFKVNRFKMYRALGFKVDEILDFIDNGKLSYIIDKVEGRQKCIDKEIIELQQQYAILGQLKEKMLFSLRKDYFKIVDKEDKLFLPASKKGVFNATKYDEFSKWVELLPLTNYSKVIDKQYFLEDEHNYHMDYGISIDKSKSSMLKDELLVNAKLIKLGKCVCFYTSIKNAKIADHSIFKHLINFLEENNLLINGDFYLEGIHINSEKGDKKGNIVWIPVKKKE